MDSLRLGICGFSGSKSWRSHIMSKFLEKAFLTSSLDLNHSTALKMIDWGRILDSRDRFMSSFLGRSKDSEG